MPDLTARQLQGFWSRVARGSESDCWPWQGWRKRGYGVHKIGSKNYIAHRLAYELLVGPIPEGLTLDHLCRNPPCVNPAHLEPVTGRENCLRGTSIPAVNARKDRCIRGHPFDEQNTIHDKRGWRFCRICLRASQREWDHKNRAKRTEQQRRRR